MDGRTDRRTTEPSHPISSPGAFGSGELKKKGISINHEILQNLYAYYQIMSEIQQNFRMTGAKLFMKLCTQEAYCLYTLLIFEQFEFEKHEK